MWQTLCYIDFATPHPKKRQRKKVQSSFGQNEFQVTSKSGLTPSPTVNAIQHW